MMELTPEYRKQIRALMEEGSLDLDSDHALTDALDTLDARDKALTDLQDKIRGLAEEWRPKKYFCSCREEMLARLLPASGQAEAASGTPEPTGGKAE